MSRFPKRTTLPFGLSAVHGSERVLRDVGTKVGDLPFEEQDLLRTKARAAGVHVGANDSYMPTLADEVMDPMAAVPHSDPEGHIRKLCRQRGVPCDGDLIKQSAPQRDPEPAVPLAEDLIQEEAQERIAREPSLAEKPAELREQIIDDHGPE